MIVPSATAHPTIRSRSTLRTWLAALSLWSLATLGSIAAEPISRYNVVWESPSKDPSGQMPLGNGDLAAGVYAIEDGDLYLLLAKNDALTYNGDIFKTGRVRVSLAPNPFAKGRTFRQTLDLATGSIGIEADDVRLRIWADANRPVYHVQIESPRELSVTAEPEFWKRIDGCRWNKTMEPVDPPTQDERRERNGNILWYFAVGNRSVFPTEMEFYDVPHLVGEHPDPYRFNTFGNLLESPDLKLKDGALRGRGKAFDVRIHALTRQTPASAEWLEAIERQARQPLDAAADWQSHCRWWSAFWDRSRMVVTDNTVAAAEREKLSGEGYTKTRHEADGGALVAQNYNVFRYLMACQSRGRIQTKFNGGLVTQPLRYDQKPRLVAEQRPDGAWISHEDDRLWGRRFTFQNQRLLYWPLLMSGDGDLMQPFFDYYWNLLPVRKAITKAWFGHAGAYYRENIEPTGGERDCSKTGADPEVKPLKTPPGGNDGKGYYHSYYFTSGLETLAMMLEYVKFTGNAAFRDRVVAPFAREILLFFDQHYPRDARGRLRLDPAMVLETWWIAVNPAPDVAGLHFCLDELLTQKIGSPEDRAHWQRLQSELPPIPLHEIEGRQALAPAAEWSNKRNSENGELYPVFPFTRFGVGWGTAEVVDWTLQHRTHKNSFGYKCWTQDQIHWAYAGNAAEAMDGLVHRFRWASPLCRFPLYGSEGPDSCPDFDHFGAGSIALQRMLVQEGNGKILLLPAWPATWDADFKLHLSGNTVIRGKVAAGRLAEWDIQPSARKPDVVVFQPQAIPERPVIPVNGHPLRVGIDQAGKSHFQGQLGRATVFRGLLREDQVRALASGNRQDKVEGTNVVTCRFEPKAGDVLPVKPNDLTGSVSFEAWINPAKNEAGRIFDKITAGKSDGFLIDCWPNSSLRIIVGSNQANFAGVLEPGAWQHVAVLLGKGRVEVFLNGKKL